MRMGLGWYSKNVVNTTRYKLFQTIYIGSETYKLNIEKIF